MITKLRFLFLAFIFVANVAVAGEDAGFAGSWVDPLDNGSSAFSLNLVQTGNRIEGYHVAIAHRGKRIDAVLPNEGKPSITGTVTEGVAHVRFRSGYDEDATGEAILTLQGDKMEWKMIKSSGAHYLPQSMVLHRQKRKAPKR